LITGDAPESDWDDWDSEVEVSETEFVMTDDDNKVTHDTSVHKRRMPIAKKRRERKVRIQESTRQEQERQIARLIREEDAVHGFQRFHGRFETVDFISKTSCGIGGWGRYERNQVARSDVGKRPLEIVSSVDVSSSIRAPPGDVSSNGVEGGRVEPEVQLDQHLSCGGSQGENNGCCNFSCSEPLDLHLDELSYCRMKGDNQISSAAESDRGWVKLKVTVDSGACDTVMPISSCDFKILPSYQSTHEMEYEVANGQSIPNLGERRCKIRTPGSREERNITFQVADVHKPLLSVTRAADAGFDCLLTDTGGHLIPRNGWHSRKDWIPIVREGNLYTMTCWVKMDERSPSPGFARQR